ncbi:DUF2975 domain-containing protein [Nocardia sp. NPDC058176]|uniref:DUF2975 domain-containing protein n=1 Tax=Nocardia sp. NPDC058176 TaxID=3346368 RepID=UPI0036D89E5A
MRSSPLRWTRSDTVVLRVALLVAIGATGLVTAYRLLWITVLPAAGDGRWNTITVSHPGGAPTHRAEIGDGISVGGSGAMEMTFHDPGTAQRLLLSAPGLIAAAAALVVLVSVLRVVGSLDKGDPFVAANARRVYSVAVAVITVALLVPVVEAFSHARLESMALGSPVSVTFEYGSSSGALLLAGVALVALAEVFRRGTRLRDDVAGLV